MREMLINMLAKQLGFSSIPKTPQEFMEIAKSNPEWASNLKRAEQEGILKRDDNGNISIIDQDKVQNVVMSYIQSMFRR